MKYDHEIIRDLMPLCIDGIASPKSQEAVEAHIAECPDCAKEWNQMNQRIEQTVQEPLPEPTAKYAETAKRVRKKNRWLLLRSTLLMLVGILLITVLGNWYHGNRYSSEAIARKFVRGCWHGDSEFLREEHHLKEICSYSKLKLRFIGEITTPDRKNRESFITAEIPDSDIIAFWACNMSRNNPLTLGMWEGEGGGSGDFSKEEQIVMVPGTLQYENGCKRMDYWMFHITDPNVSKIVVQAFGEKQILVPDQGFGYISREMTAYEKMTDHTESDHITEGEAFDANGTVLYRIRQAASNEDCVISYEWEKAE